MSLKIQALNLNCCRDLLSESDVECEAMPESTRAPRGIKVTWSDPNTIIHTP